MLNKKCFVIEYSQTQKTVNITTLEKSIQLNLFAILSSDRKRKTDWVIVGVHETYLEASDFCDGFIHDLKLRSEEETRKSVNGYHEEMNIRLNGVTAVSPDGAA